MKICPECQCNQFFTDFIKQEVTCKHCGLVLLGPMEYGIQHKGFRFVSHRKRCFKVEHCLKGHYEYKISFNL